MADPALGINAWFGWGKETTPGTAVAVDKWMRCRSMGFGLRHTPAQPEVLRLGPSQTIGGRKWADGQIVAPFTWTGQEELLELAMGSIATTVDQASVRWLHTLKDAAALPAMTAEGANEGVTSCQGKGVKISTLTFSQAVDDQLLVAYDMLGQIHTTALATPSTESFSADTGPNWDGWVFKIAGTPVTFQVYGFTWTHTRNTGADRFPLATTRTMAVPQSGRVAVTLDIQAEFEATAEITNWLNATEQDLELINTGPVLGNANYSLALTLPNGVWTGEYPSTGSPDPVPLRLTAVGNYDSGDATWGMIELKNATATP